jgi:Arf/Sar family protein
MESILQGMRCSPVCHRCCRTAKIPTAWKELHKLPDGGSIGSKPLLILANKIDIKPHVDENKLIEELQLNYVRNTPWIVLPTSAFHVTNLDQVVEWLTEQGKN